MARTRSIRPGFFANEVLGELPPLMRLLFAGTWTIADREGRLVDRPRKIKAEVLPYDKLNVDKALDELAERGFIQRYEIDDERYIQVTNWRKHQHPHPKEDVSHIPAPEGYADDSQVNPGPGPGLTPDPDPGLYSDPDPGAPPGPGSSTDRARLVASSSFPSRSFNSLREEPPNPPDEQGGQNRRRSRRREQHGEPEYVSPQDERELWCPEHTGHFIADCPACRQVERDFVTLTLSRIPR